MSNDPTDDQLRALREEAWETFAEASRALGFSPHGGKINAEEARTARYRCAEILREREATEAATRTINETPPGDRRATFGTYTAVEGKLGAGDSRRAYVTGPTGTGRIAPLASFWYYEEAVRWAREHAAKEGA